MRQRMAASKNCSLGNDAGCLLSDTDRLSLRPQDPASLAASIQLRNPVSTVQIRA